MQQLSRADAERYAFTWDASPPLHWDDWLGPIVVTARTRRALRHFFLAG